MKTSRVLSFLDRIGCAARDRTNMLLLVIAVIAAGVGFVTSSVVWSFGTFVAGVALWAGLAFFADIETNLERQLEAYEASAKALGYESLEAAKAAGKGVEVIRHAQANHRT